MREKAFVLRRSPYRDSDLIVTFLTERGSKLSLLARGALRSRKRFGGGLLEPTHLLQIDYQESAGSSRLGVLAEAQILESFIDLRSSYERLMVALSLVEEISHVAQEGDLHSEGLFRLLGKALFDLQHNQNLDVFSQHFSMRLQQELGLER